jgi:hypothetical protein
MAKAQGDENYSAAFANSLMGNANTVGPQGSTRSDVTSYIQDPTTGRQIPRFTQTTTMSPAEQRVYDQEAQMRYTMAGAANKAAATASSALAKGFKPTGLPAWQKYGAGPALVEPDAAYQDKIRQNMMSAYNRDVAPQQSAEDAQLAARGMEPGGQMYYNIANQRQDALGAQSLQAYNQAGGEARAQAEGINKPRQQVWQNANTNVDQSNALRGAMYGEQGDMYNRQLGSIGALAGMGQSYMPSSPGFSGGQVNPFDIAGAQMQKYGIDANNAAQKNAGIFSLAGGAMKMLPFSDRRAKTDIVPIGASLAGAPLYTFKYWLDGVTHVGVMADEVKKIHPDAVHMINGFDHVDYAVLSRRHANG